MSTADPTRTRTTRPITEYFAVLRDPRIELKCEHDFMAIIMICFVGTLLGADDFVGMRQIAVGKREWLQNRLRLNLTNGIPSHDTLTRVFGALDPEAFEGAFRDWVGDLVGDLKLQHIPIDGKESRGSKAGGRKALRVVSAWARANGVTLGQVQVSGDSNEIPAIPELLRLLDISGALVSIDAIGCQTEIAAQVIEQKGDYLLAVKGNQPHLLEDITTLVDAALENEFADLSQATTTDQKHGRLETRFCFVIDNLEGIRDLNRWAELKSVIGLISTREINGKTSEEVRYYISSRKASAEVFLDAIRGHWSIENNCHWVLDVVFREDDHRLREGHGPANMSIIRKMALAMLKKANTKIGIKNKRLRAAVDEDFLEHILRDFLED